MSRLPASPDSVKTIRNRLQVLLLRAFGAVVLLTILLVLVAILVVIVANPNPLVRSPLSVYLKVYYLAHGSWDGVETLLGADPQVGRESLEPEWRNTILLDNQGRVVFYYGRKDAPQVGQVYARGALDIVSYLRVGDQTIGALVLQPSQLIIGHPLRFGAGLILPIGVISLLLGLLTLLIGMLLMRRVVNPLSGVIAAAKAVADGDLSARAPASPAHDDLRALSDHFNDMAEQIERSDRERRNLMADITHELRTPLTVLRGRLEGMLDGIYPADAEHIAPALEEAYLLERLTDDLRLLTLAETHQLRYEVRPVNLGEQAERAVGLFNAEAGERNIDLKLVVEKNLPLVQADPQRVEQVIGNLLGNALRYTPEGGWVTVQVAASDGNVELRVADSGPGVEATDLPFIFDRFWRGDKSRARATGGAGLGLAIARQLVEAQGGNIAAHNCPEGGLEVMFTLPAS
jgi:signal transduction histidine kinase